MLEVNKTMLNYSLIKQAMFWVQSRTDEKLFASTIGTRLDISTTFVCPYVTATAVTNDDSQSRSFNIGGQAKGWEMLLENNLLEKAPEIYFLILFILD